MVCDGWQVVRGRFSHTSLLSFSPGNEMQNASMLGILHMDVRFYVALDGPKSQISRNIPSDMLHPVAIEVCETLVTGFPTFSTRASRQEHDKNCDERGLPYYLVCTERCTVLMEHKWCPVLVENKG